MAWNHREWEEADALRLLPRGPRRFLEVGVYEGETMCWLYNKARASEADEYVGIDPWAVDSLWKDVSGATQIDASRAETRAKRYLAATWANRGVLVKCSSLFVLSEPVPKYISRGFSFIFIDGWHSHKCVIQDSELTWPFLDDGGILSWDDYGLPSTHRNVVAPAVHEFLASIEGQYAEVSRGKAMTIQKVSA